MEWPWTPEWLEQLGWLRLDLLVRLVLAAVLGGAVGIERELSDKPAGFRTNLLICVGAALLTDLSILVSRAADPLETNADPARIAAQIVSGIGFLGAGTIIQSRGGVVGLTTAATLWVVAAIGMTVGAGGYVEAVGTTILVIIALMLLGRVEARLTARPTERTVRVELMPGREVLETVREALAEAGFRASVLEVSKDHDAWDVTLRVRGRDRSPDAVVTPLLALSGVRRVSQL